jgi:nucleotide-binding universal stress UspA family protein
MIKKILVPTDGSDTAGKAVKYAIGLSKQMGSTITLLAVVDDRYFMTQC